MDIHLDYWWISAFTSKGFLPVAMVDTRMYFWQKYTSYSGRNLPVDLIDVDFCFFWIFPVFPMHIYVYSGGYLPILLMDIYLPVTMVDTCLYILLMDIQPYTSDIVWKLWFHLFNLCQLILLCSRYAWSEHVLLSPPVSRNYLPRTWKIRLCFRCTSMAIWYW
jgi:hypothetical protein